MEVPTLEMKSWLFGRQGIYMGVCVSLHTFASLIFNLSAGSDTVRIVTGLRDI